MWDERVNDAIDEVARQTTEGAPGDAAAFRRRVLARIERGDAPRRSWRAAFVLSPVAVAAAILIAIVVGRDRDVRRGNSAAPQARVAPDTTGAPPQRRDPETAAASAAVETAPPLRSPAARGRAVASADGDPRVLEPAAPVDSIAVAPLTVDLLTTDAMQMERLETIAPITVAPLDITDSSRRNE